ncbi:MAG: hypothetical protein ACI915_000005 [Gammaproteobacteria bacterium]|jgi:hypothetical protein
MNLCFITYDPATAHVKVFAGRFRVRISGAFMVFYSQRDVDQRDDHQQLNSNWPTPIKRCAYIAVGFTFSGS